MENELGMSPEEMETFLENVRKFTFIQFAKEEVDEPMYDELYDLMMDQYPILRDEQRPKIVEIINSIVDGLGFRLMLTFNRLLEEDRAGVDHRVKHPDLDNWRLEHEKEPDLRLHDPDVNPYPPLTDEMWRELAIEHNKEEIRWHNWYEKRKFDFIHIVQDWILWAYEDLYELSSDGLIVYAMILDMAYDEYHEACAEMETFIDSGFPEEDYDNFFEKYDALSTDERLHSIHISHERHRKQMEEYEKGINEELSSN